MPRSAPFVFRSVALWAAAAAGVALLAVLLRGLFAPDPYASYFFKAQQLEARGLTELALKHYKLLSDSHPESAFAPAALEAEANLLTGLGRKNGNRAQLQDAVVLYRRLADTYANDRAAGKALIAAGDIAANDMQDRATARVIFADVLTRFPNNGFYASQATLKLGHLSMDEGKRDEARTLLQRVLQHYPTFPEACSEAQYQLGVLFETLFKNKTWAENAYRATITRYAATVWASNARQRLGLLIYQMSSTRHPDRLVLIETQPLPDDTSDTDAFARGTLTAALRPILAARGLNADVTTLRGWSLEPFWAAFDPGHPASVSASPISPFNNIADSAGLFYDRRQHTDGAAALLDLQGELDGAHPTVIYNGQWQLAVGYDSEHQEVLLQSRGARVQKVSVKEFQDGWKRKSPGGGAFTLLSFYAPGERTRVRRLPNDAADAAVSHIESVGGKPLVVGPVGTPEPSPTPTAPPLLGLRPTFVFELKPLSSADAHKRTLHRAATLMLRARDGDVLLNLEALNALASELERLGTPPGVMPKLTPEPPLPLPAAEATAQSEVPPDENALPTPTAVFVPEPTPLAPIIVPDTPVNAARQVARALALLGWFKAPLQRWIGARRDAAAYLDASGAALHQPQLNRAADDLRASIAALARAAAALPSANTLGGSALSPAARRGFAEAARQLHDAREREKRATAAMQSA